MWLRSALDNSGISAPQSWGPTECLLTNTPATIELPNPRSPSASVNVKLCHGSFRALTLPILMSRKTVNSLKVLRHSAHNFPHDFIWNPGSGPQLHNKVLFLMPPHLHSLFRNAIFVKDPAEQLRCLDRSDAQGVVPGQVDRTVPNRLRFNYFAFGYHGHAASTK